MDLGDSRSGLGDKTWGTNRIRRGSDPTVPTPPPQSPHLFGVVLPDSPWTSGSLSRVQTLVRLDEET